MFLSIGIMGAGNVGSSLIDQFVALDLPKDEIQIYAVLIKDMAATRAHSEIVHYSNDVKWFAESEGMNVVVEALTDNDLAYEMIVEAIKQKKSVITCNKWLVQHRGAELAALAEEHGTVIYLNSIPASAGPDPLDDVELTHRTIFDYSDGELYGFKGADGEVTARYVLKDITNLYKALKENLARWNRENVSDQPTTD